MDAFQFRKLTAAPIATDSIAVYDAGTLDLVADLTDLSGAALANPFTVTAGGGVDAWGFRPAALALVDVLWVEAAVYLAQNLTVGDDEALDRASTAYGHSQTAHAPSDATAAGVSGDAHALTAHAAQVVPGGSDTQVQFNDAGAFGGNSGLTFNKATGQLSLTGDFISSGISYRKKYSFTTNVPTSGDFVWVKLPVTIEPYTDENNPDINVTIVRRLSQGGATNPYNGCFIKIRGMGNNYAGPCPLEIVYSYYGYDQMLTNAYWNGPLNSIFLRLYKGSTYTVIVHNDSRAVGDIVNDAADPASIPGGSDVVTGFTLLGRTAGDPVYLKANRFYIVGTGWNNVTDGTEQNFTLGYGRHRFGTGNTMGYLENYYASSLDTISLGINFKSGANVVHAAGQYSSTIQCRAQGATAHFRYLAGPGSGPPVEKFRIDKDGNVGLNGQTTFGTSAVGVLAIASGTAPTTSPADAVQIYVEDQSAGNAGLVIRAEGGQIHKIGQIVNLFSDAIQLSSVPAITLYGSSSKLSLGGTGGANLVYDAAYTLGLRGGLNAQTFNIYNTYTDASNYERGFARYNGNVFEIGTEAAGTGTKRAINILSGAAGNVIIKTQSTGYGSGLLVLNGPGGNIASSAVLGLGYDNGSSIVSGQSQAQIGIYGKRDSGYIMPMFLECVATQNWAGTAYFSTRLSNYNSTSYAVTLTGPGNVGFNNQATFGSGAAGVLAIASGTAPTTSPADAVQIYVEDQSAGNAGLVIRAEGGEITKIGKQFSHTVTGGQGSRTLAFAMDGNGYHGLYSENFYILRVGEYVSVASVHPGGIYAAPNKCLGFSSSYTAEGDTRLYRDAAGSLALRNGTNAQTFNIYNTYTDASNYERGFARWNADVFEIGTANAGTGSSRVLSLINGAATLTLPTSTGTLARIEDAVLRTEGLVETGTAYNSSSLSASGLTLDCTAALTVTLETYSSRSEGFQFAVIASGGDVTFSGTFDKKSTFTKLARGDTAWVVRKSGAWHVSGLSS